MHSGAFARIAPALGRMGIPEWRVRTAPPEGPEVPPIGASLGSPRSVARVRD